MNLVKFIHGTIDFVFCVGTTKFLGWATRRAVTTQVFRNKMKIVKGSPWITKRIVDQKIPLWKRGIHVPDEGAIKPLKDNLKIQRDVDYVIQEHDACFPAETLVRMADGTEKPIKDVRVGEYVRSRDGKSRKVLRTWYHGPSQLWLEILSHDRRLIVTPNHPLFVEGFGWVYAAAFLEIEAVLNDLGTLNVQPEAMGSLAPFQIEGREMATSKVRERRSLSRRDRQTRQAFSHCRSHGHEETWDRGSRRSFGSWTKQDHRPEELELERRCVQRSCDRQGSTSRLVRLESATQTLDQRTRCSLREVRSYSEDDRSTSHHAMATLSGAGVRRNKYFAALQEVSQGRRRDLLSDGRRTLQVRWLPQISLGRYDLEVEEVHEYIAEGFVVHNSRAGRHFDLRLVMNGKSVSWAIPMKGKRDLLDRFPKSDAVPPERWAAIRQPDHTVEYNKFEGTIPEGNLGAGTVKIWAAGKADVYKIEDGNVHFKILSGPAKGSYVLVSTHGNQGLLISKKPEEAEIWTKPSYTKKPVEILDVLEHTGTATAERKVDGASVELRISDGHVRTLSHRVSKRTGQLVDHSDRIVHLDSARTERLGSSRLRAEAWHPRGVNFLSGTLNSNPERAREIQRSAGPVRLDVFDITEYKGKDVRGLPYSERRALYEKVCEEMADPYVKPVRSQSSGFNRFYEQQVNLKKAPTDGVVIKDITQPYDAKPWVKVKPSELSDCEVVGVTEGLGKFAGSLGALTVRCEDGKQVQVGTGFSDWERGWIWKHRAEMEGEVARVAFHVRSGERTATGPRFDSFHPDKSEVALKMYADVMDVSRYALKTAAGWKP